MHFPLHNHLVREYPSRVGHKLDVHGQRIQIGQRAAHVARNHVEENFGRGSEEADIEIGVEKDGCDVGAVEHVLQVFRGCALAIQRLLELVVERIELLVERLQFFLGGEQLLVGGLIFLVERQRLLGPCDCRGRGFSQSFRATAARTSSITAFTAANIRCWASHGAARTSLSRFRVSPAKDLGGMSTLRLSAGLEILG